MHEEVVDFAARLELDAGQADEGLRFVDRAVGHRQRRVLGHASAVEQTGGAVVAFACVVRHRNCARYLRRVMYSGSDQSYPCDGLRVLDMSRVVAGPIAGRILSDLGADVVKLEPPEGDVTRVWGQIRHGLSGFYTQQNAGKRNVCVDLRAEGARRRSCKNSRRRPTS